MVYTYILQIKITITKLQANIFKVFKYTKVLKRFVCFNVLGYLLVLSYLASKW